MKSRSVCLKNPILDEQLLLTTYFSSKKDPQKKINAPSVDITYIKPWYDSVNKLELNGYILHDHLPGWFIDRYSTRHTKFISCKLGNYSLNDERFFLYLNLLLNYCPNVKRVFMTDGNDVFITKDPFPLVDLYLDNKLFVGRNNGNLLRQSYINREVRIPIFEKDYGEKLSRSFYNQPIYNAGILGGNIQVVIPFLKELTSILGACDTNNNNNMVAFNYAIHTKWYFRKHKRGLADYVPIRWYGLLERIFFNRITMNLTRLFYNRQKDHDNKNDFIGNNKHIVTSYPLCSAFKQYEEDSDAYFIHK